MPYIPQKEREKYEKALTEIETILDCLPIMQWAGEFTYIVYRLLKRFSKSYCDRALAMGCLMAAMFEIYRREHAHYEDSKIKINGDIL